MFLFSIFVLLETLTSVRALYSMSMMLMIGALCYPPFYKNMSNGVVKIGIMSILTSVGGKSCKFWPIVRKINACKA